MKIKAFEVRDRGTFIAVLAIQMSSTDNMQENYLLRRSGYGVIDPAIMVVRMDANGKSDQASSDPYGWNSARTMQEAHDYIQKNFDELLTGSVVDVQFILGETTNPKQSESIV